MILTEMPDIPMGLSPPTPAPTSLTTTATTPSSSISNTSVFASIFASSTISKLSQTPPQPPPSFSNMMCALARSDYPASALEPTSLSLASSLYLSTNASSLFPTPDQDHHRYTPSPQPAMSATALLQKAAQMGAAASNPSLLRGLGLAVSSSSPSSGQDSDVKLESNSVAAGLGLGLPSGDVMMGQSSLFGSRPTTLDLLGLGIGAGGTSTSGLSALLNSFGGGGGSFDVGAAAYGGGGGGGSSPGGTWEGGPERKPNGPTLL